MKLSGIRGCAALLTLLATNSVMAAPGNPVVDINIVNETYGTLKLISYTSNDGQPQRPLTAYNVGPGTTERMKIQGDWDFSFRNSRFVGLKNRGPMTTTLTYETHDGLRCTVSTRLSVTQPGFELISFLEPDLIAKRTYTVRSSGVTDGENRCQLNASTMGKAPFSYSLELVIGTNDSRRKEF